MLVGLQKALRVVDKLKRIPYEEREWLLTECKQLVVEYDQAYREEFAKAGPATRLPILTRLRTLEVARELLDSIRLKR